MAAQNVHILDAVRSPKTDSQPSNHVITMVKLKSKRKNVASKNEKT